MNIEYRNIVSVKELLGMLKTISDNIEYLSENSEKYVDLTLDVLKDSKVKELSKKLKDFQDKNYVQTAYSFSENNIKDAEIWVNEYNVTKDTIYNIKSLRGYKNILPELNSLLKIS